MSINPPRAVTINCPACRAQYTVPVQNVVDVGRDPRFKQLLLQGRLNVGVCPNCGTGGMLSIPLIYHDPEKELLFCLIPQELNITETERQRTIGQLSNAIINNLPPHQRKGYLLQPRLFLTFQTLLEAILEADGITKEMLEQQHQKALLIDEMMQAVDDPIRLAAVIDEHEDQIDYEFFTLLTANIAVAEQSTQTESAEKLVKLREALLQRTATGQRVAEQQRTLERALEGLDEDLTREDLMERIIAIEGEHVDQVLSVLIALARPLVDYQFFQLLTQRIERAEGENDAESAGRLKALRAKILDLAQRIDAEARERMQEKAQLLAEILQSADPRSTIQAHVDEIDSVFLSVLEANIEQSEQQQRHEAVDRLRAVRNTIVQILQEGAPPEIRFINRLLQADYPEGTRKILMENPAMVNAELVSMLEVLAADFADRGGEQTGERLNGIRAQAELLLQ